MTNDSASCSRRGRRLRRDAAAVVLAALMLAGVRPALAASDEHEETLKAAYLFNFLRFVDVAADSSSADIDVCIVDSPQVQRALEVSPNAQQLDSHRIVVRPLQPTESPKGCEVVYIPSAAAAKSRPLLHEARGAALTVGDAPEFTAHGGVIRLFTQNNRLRFVINLGNAQHAGLRISSNLLRLATSVEQTAAP